MPLSAEDRVVLEEWLHDYDNRVRKPKPWTEDEWMQDWANAIVAKKLRSWLEESE
jgi:hypothetical protein